MSSRDDDELICAILAFVCPAVAVFLAGYGVGQIILNIILSLLTFSIGGIIHALCLVLKNKNSRRLTRLERRREILTKAENLDEYRIPQLVTHIGSASPDPKYQQSIVDPRLNLMLNSSKPPRKQHQNSISTQGLRQSRLMGKENRADERFSNQSTSNQEISSNMPTLDNLYQAGEDQSTHSREKSVDKARLDRDLPTLPFMQRNYIAGETRPISEVPTASSIYTRPSPNSAYDFDEEAQPAPLFSGASSRTTAKTAGGSADIEYPAEEYNIQWGDSPPITTKNVPEQEKMTFQERMKRAGQGLALQPLEIREMNREPWSGASGQASLMTPIPASNASVSNASAGESLDVSPVEPPNALGRASSKAAPLSPVSSVSDFHEERQRATRTVDRKTSDTLLQKPTWNVSRRIEQFSKSNSSLSSTSTAKASTYTPDKIPQPRIEQFANSESGSPDSDSPAGAVTPEKLAAPRIQRYAVISQANNPIKKKAIPRMEKFSVGSTTPRSPEQHVERTQPSISQVSKIPIPISNTSTTYTLNTRPPVSSTLTTHILTDMDEDYVSSPTHMRESSVPASPRTPTMQHPSYPKTRGLRPRGLSTSSITSSPPLSPPRATETPEKSASVPVPVSRFSWTTRATSVENSPMTTEDLQQTFEVRSQPDLNNSPQQHPIPYQRPFTSANDNRESPNLPSRFSWTTTAPSEMTTSPSRNNPRQSVTATEEVLPLPRKQTPDGESIMSRAHPFAKMRSKSSQITKSFSTPTSPPAPVTPATVSPAPVAAQERVVHVVKRKPAPAILGAKQPSAQSKELPLSPQALASVDIITALQAQLDDFELKRINLGRLLDSITKLEMKPQSQNPLVRDLARRKRDAQRQAEIEQELADVKRQEYEVGLRLHMAWKRREQEAPSALWVRRVTG